MPENETVLQFKMTKKLFNPPEQGSPTPRPWTSTNPWPVRNWTTEQEQFAGFTA